MPLTNSEEVGEERPAAGDIASGLGGAPEGDDPAREARRQSPPVSGYASVRDVLNFVDLVTHDQRWL